MACEKPERMFDKELWIGQLCRAIAGCDSIVFCFEFVKENIFFERQKSVPLIHQTIKLDAGFRADIIIEDKMLLELKSIELLADIYYKQVQTYLKLTNLKLGC